MKRSTYVMIAAFIGVLGGCGSFNNSFNSYLPPPVIQKIDNDRVMPDMAPDDEIPAPPVNTPPVIQGVPQQIIVETAGTTCHISPWPIPGKFPELPARAVQAAAGDAYALERIWRQHVDELRAYISERRRLQREAREDFNEKCRAVGK